MAERLFAACLADRFGDAGICSMPPLLRTEPDLLGPCDASRRTEGDIGAASSAYKFPVLPLRVKPAFDSLRTCASGLPRVVGPPCSRDARRVLGGMMFATKAPFQQSHSPYASFCLPSCHPLN